MNASSNREDPSLESRSARTCVDRRQSAAQFHRLLRTGNYDAIIGRGLRRALRAAAADTSLEPEIGALRLTLVYLLNQETDLASLASSIARVSSVAIQAARLRDGSDDAWEKLHQIMLQQVEMLDSERVESGKAQSVSHADSGPPMSSS